MTCLSCPPWEEGRREINMKMKEKIMGQRPRDLIWSHGLAYILPLTGTWWERGRKGWRD